ncbi:hypothetical protein E4U55_006035 [Claviceps digitariae]|nr:hypothetical protein E4U55_006035 [Claviceps digitariae]
MSYPVRRMTTSAAPAPAPGSSGEAHPTTATVLDYNCLFTHDLKRKQKRWQDGKLKYHTFNKKIMVYDDRGNFIGDAHWQAGGHLEEDEELGLDRGAAIVQVADFVGSREQDLTEVLDKRTREVEKRRAVAAAKTPAPSRARAGPAAAAAAAAAAQSPASESAHFQLRHRPLNSIVPSPGPLGRASIPNRSPYEARKAHRLGAPQEQELPSARKRRRSPSPPSKAGFARSLFGAALSLSSSASGPTNRSAWALKERGVNVQEIPNGETSDDDVVVVEERPRMKAPLYQSRHLEEKAFKRPQKLSREGVVLGEGDSLSKNRISYGQSSSKLLRSTDGSSVQPESRCVLASGGSRKAQVMEDELVEQREQCSVKESDIVHGSTDVIRPPRQAASSSFKRATHILQEEKRPTSISDEGSKRNEANISHRRTAVAHQQKHGTMENNSAASELPGSVSPEPQERRTELRIRSRKRRGLLMVAEMRSERQARQSYASTEPNMQSMTADSTVAGRKLPLDRSDTTNLDECTVTATPEHTSKSASALQTDSEEYASCNGPAPNLSDQPAEVNLVPSDLAPDVSVARDKQSKSPEQGVEHSRQLRQSSPEDTLGEAFVESQKVSEMDDSRSHNLVDSGKTPTDSPGKERAEATSPREEQIEMTKLVIEDEASQQGNERSELSGIAGAQTNARRAKPEESPAIILTDEESEDFPPARKTRPRKRVEPPPSSDEMLACHAPTRRRSARTKRNCRAATAVDSPSGESDCDAREGRLANETNEHSEAISEEEESDCTSRKRPKRRQSKKNDCELALAHETAKLAGPHIKRLARKSVKSKEIFGFVPSFETGQMTPHPFSMTASRIGVVGRPPTAPHRPPGISLTIKPGLRCHDRGAIDGQDAEKVEQHISGGQPDHDAIAAERVPNGMDDIATATRPAPAATAAALEQDVNGLPASKENVPDDRPVPRAKIANPATRGKKAARKTDAAGQAPQHLVPFEPPQPVRPVPKARPSGPSVSTGRGATLPGFSTAKGGAWSAHAEDLLGMTRPTGKRA